MAASNVPTPLFSPGPIGSIAHANAPLQIPGYTNINYVKSFMHFPGLHPEADIQAVHFRRRKTKGFSNGHYLQFNPQAFHHNKSFRRAYYIYFVTGFLTFNSLFAIQQARRGKWFFGNNYVPPFFNDKYLERIGRK